MWDQVTLNIPSIQRKAQMRLPSSLDPDELDEDEDSHLLSKLHISTEVPSSTDESSRIVQHQELEDFLRCNRQS